jgi:hypothetical protein
VGVFSAVLGFCLASEGVLALCGAGEHQARALLTLHDRLAAIERAEQRLADGTYGRSVRDGVPIPDTRLEVNPEAEFTVEGPRPPVFLRRTPWGSPVCRSRSVLSRSWRVNLRTAATFSPRLKERPMRLHNARFPGGGEARGPAMSCTPALLPDYHPFCGSLSTTEEGNEDRA